MKNINLVHLDVCSFVRSFKFEALRRILLGFMVVNDNNVIILKDKSVKQILLQNFLLVL